MVPLTTVQGFAPEALRALLGARPLYLWGSGDVALDVLTSLRRMGFSPCAFFDTRVRAGESVQVCGLPCLPTQAGRNLQLPSLEPRIGTDPGVAATRAVQPAMAGYRARSNPASSAQWAWANNAMSAMP